MNEVGDIDDIKENLLSNYEVMAEATVRTIHLEPELELALILKRRVFIKKWCRQMFAPFLLLRNYRILKFMPLDLSKNNLYV